MSKKYSKPGTYNKRDGVMLAMGAGFASGGVILTYLTDLIAKATELFGQIKPDVLPAMSGGWAFVLYFLYRLYKSKRAQELGTKVLLFTGLDYKKLLQGAVMAAAGALLTYFTDQIQNIPPEYQPIATAIWSIVSNALWRLVKGEPST